jgi:hypothetical protein
MFFPGSRYETTNTYSVTLPNGKIVRAIQLPLPQPKPLLGYHRRLEGQRLDLIANRYLKDATAFWKLCAANNAIAPDALAARDLVGIPRKD